MARSEKNLTAVFTDTAAAIRAKTNTSETICPLDFADKINAIETGGTGGGMKAYFEAGGKCGYTKAASLDSLINYTDTENVSDFSYFFDNSRKLESVPNISTASAIGSMEHMFYYCYKLTTVPSNLNTSNINNMTGMFTYCAELTAIPFMDTSKVNIMSEMFYHCEKITTIPKLDTSRVTSMSYMFSGCKRLQVIPELDLSNCTDLNGAFGDCVSLTEIHMKGMTIPFDIHYSSKFTREALVEIFNNLGTPRSTYSTTITIGETNLAKLTEEDKAIATNKGWKLK